MRACGMSSSLRGSLCRCRRVSTSTRAVPGLRFALAKVKRGCTLRVEERYRRIHYGRVTTNTHHNKDTYTLYNNATWNLGIMFNTIKAPM